MQTCTINENPRTRKRATIKNIYTYVVNQKVHSGKIGMFYRCAFLGSLNICRYFFSIRIGNILTIKYNWIINVALFHGTQPCPFGRSKVLYGENLYKTRFRVTRNGGYSGKIRKNIKFVRQRSVKTTNTEFHEIPLGGLGE